MRLLAFFLALESVAAFSGGARPPTGVSSTSSSSDSSNARLDRLEIAAVPRATPKKESTPEPLPLWGLPTPPEQRGPSVFKLNQGRAIDVLRHDYPRLFTERPDMSIFTDNIELHDPSGKRLAGKKKYERVFDALRFLRRTTMQDAQVGIRLVADDKSVRAVTLASEAPFPPRRQLARLSISSPCRCRSLERRSACAGMPSSGCATRPLASRPSSTASPRSCTSTACPSTTLTRMV